MSEPWLPIRVGRALRGAVGFLTRLPVAADGDDWAAFRRRAYTIPLVGYLIGALAGLAFVLPLQPPTVVAGYLVSLSLVSGITHADGLADVGDALAVHGDRSRRLAVLKDSATGVGGALALTTTLLVLTLGALSFAGIDAMTAFRLVLAAEVGAKLGMALVVCYGRSAHEGIGSQLIEPNDSRAFGPALLVSLPVVALGPPGTAPALLGALLTGPLVGLAALTWGHRALGGVTGDVIGASNEVARALALHVGVSAWLLL